MPIGDEADTGQATGANLLDGKPLPIDNIFDPANLKSQGLSLDEDTGDEEEEEDQEEDEGTEEVDEVDESEEDEEIDEEEVDTAKVLNKYKTPEELAKALANTQKLLGKQSNEVGTLRQQNEAAMELLRRMTGKDPDSQTSEDKTREAQDSPFPKDELGIPNPPDSYWREEYLQTLKTYYLNYYTEQGYDEIEAKSLATTDAWDRMNLERDKWNAEYRQKRESAQSEYNSTLEKTLAENKPKQEATIATEMGRVRAKAQQMGVDPEAATSKTLEVAGIMVQKALEMGKITMIQASSPEVAEQAIWEAWSYVNRHDLIPPPGPATAKKAASPHPVEASGRSAPSATKAASRAADSGEGYSKAHIDLAKQLGMTPKEMADRYGKL
jgi:hypothetical protein